MPGMLDSLRKGIVECGLTGTRVLVAVSGGADSVALLRGLAVLRHEFSLVLRAAHLDHQLREGSPEDARWVGALCEQHGIPLVLRSADIRADAQRTGEGLEESARRLRYEFLEQAAADHQCSRVALAHTGDDQVETVLHHILRGTGMAGLRGMRAARSLSSGVLLVRPMLGISRAEVEAYLRELRQEFRSDESNLSTSFTRNRIRHVLLPLLREQFNPQVEDAVGRLSRQAAEIDDHLRGLASALLRDALLDAGPTTARLNCDVLAKQPRHLIRESLSLLWEQQTWPRQRLGFAELDRLAGLVLETGAATLPGGIRAARRGRLLVLERSGNPR